MPHNNRRLTSTYTHYSNETPCGISQEFKTENQSKLWVKLHRKNCKLCAVADNAHNPTELTLLK